MLRHYLHIHYPLIYSSPSLSPAPPVHRSLGNAPAEPHPRPLSDVEWLGLGQLTGSKGRGGSWTDDSVLMEIFIYLFHIFGTLGIKLN